MHAVLTNSYVIMRSSVIAVRNRVYGTGESQARNMSTRILAAPQNHAAVMNATMSSHSSTLKQKHRHRKAVQAVQAYVDRLLVPLPSSNSSTDSNNDDATATTKPSSLSDRTTPLVITEALALCHERFVAAVARQIVAANKTESSSSAAKVQRVNAAAVKEALVSLELSHLVTTLTTTSADIPDAATTTTTKDGTTVTKKRAARRQPCQGTTAVTKKQRRNRQYSVLDEAEQERLLNLSREKLLGTTQPKV
jgi:hypothetical protein